MSGGESTAIRCIEVGFETLKICIFFLQPAEQVAGSRITAASIRFKNATWKLLRTTEVAEAGRRNQNGIKWKRRQTPDVRTKLAKFLPRLGSACRPHRFEVSLSLLFGSFLFLFTHQESYVLSRIHISQGVLLTIGSFPYTPISLSISIQSTFITCLIWTLVTW